MSRLSDLQRLTEAVRRIIEATATTGIEGDDLERAVTAAEALADRLSSSTDADPWAARAAVDDWPSSTPSAFTDILPLSPVIGPFNPVAPPVHLELVDGEVRGRVRLGTAYVGPPGRVHGGWVAAILDQVLGLTTLAAGHPGMTATLTVHMRRATPLDQELTLLGRHVGASGRRSTVWAGIYADGELTAEAEGLLVLPRQDAWTATSS